MKTESDKDVIAQLLGKAYASLRHSEARAKLKQDMKARRDKGSKTPIKKLKDHKERDRVMRMKHKAPKLLDEDNL